ncbi:hypothetical protein AN403_6271 [Pseudomonas fluorescens]|uniref:Uncharacterized protein n=1 Tax=Pseudomonas fluorescens TaxID=294 RepID=A0A0P8XXM2_PSEFL|nr:hypothetical protein AN403_6271 [Pseudomonas fluorescens]
MVPFSSTLGVAVKVTVVASLTSLTVVLTGVFTGLIASRLPPAAALIDSVTVSGARCAGLASRSRWVPDH